MGERGKLRWMSSTKLRHGVAYWSCDLGTGARSKCGPTTVSGICLSVGEGEWRRHLFNPDNSYSLPLSLESHLNAHFVLNLYTAESLLLLLFPLETLEPRNHVFFHLTPMPVMWPCF